MFAIHEIEMENTKSVFPRLFYFLAKNIAETCGRGGEGAVRAGVRAFATDRGRNLKQAHRTSGKLTNVKTYQCAPDQPRDTRQREKILQLHEEVCLKEVYTCPYADEWGRYNACDIGQWFCEEFEKARFEAYTEGVGQMHLSQSLTENRNNHCRLAMYYRKANISQAAAEEAFSEDRFQPAKESDWCEDFWLTESERCLGLYRSLYSAAVTSFGELGRCAVVAGLKEFAEDALQVMASQAKRTLRPCDVAFAEKNFPLDLVAGGNNPDDAAALLEKHVLAVIRKKLDKPVS